MSNMFKSVLAVGGSGGSGADLIVTCSANFAGSIITCTDGTNTFTETCPSSSPYEVTFESIPTGTYTISGVASGQTVSTTKTILDFDAELNAIPDGSTVTPTDDIQIWLHCANIWDKDYTTISQVLADASTVQALVASNNAADYMARSTTWSTDVTADSSAMSYIGLNDYCSDALLYDSTWLTAICNSTYFESILNIKVPTMTSDTTPSGEAFADSSKTNAWKSFDGNDATQPDGGGGTEHYFGYDFETNVKVLKVAIKGYGGNTKNAIQYSNDKSIWSDAQTLSESDIGSNVLKTHNISDSGSHRYWRFYESNTVSFTGMIYTLQFYGRASS